MFSDQAPRRVLQRFSAFVLYDFYLAIHPYKAKVVQYAMVIAPNNTACESDKATPAF